MPGVRLPLFQRGLGGWKEASNLSIAVARNLVSAIWSWRFEKIWQPASLGEVLYSLTGAEGRRSPVDLATFTPIGSSVIVLGMGWWWVGRDWVMAQVPEALLFCTEI